MVVLYLESYTSEFTVVLERPIPCPTWLTLHSASVSSSRLLESKGKVLSNRAGVEPLISIPPGEYTLKSLKQAFDSAQVDGPKVPLFSIEGGSGGAGSQSVKIEASNLIFGSNMTLNTALSGLLGLPTTTKGKNPISWPAIGTVFVHCDLVDSSVVFQSESKGTLSRANILARFDAPSPTTLLRVKARSVEHVHTLHIRVLDDKGAAIYIHNIPISLVLEIS